MKATTSRRLLLIGGVFALLSAGAAAQGFYDDDIYFDASKARKEKAVKATKTKPAAKVYSVPATVVTGAVDAEAGSSRNVDEYNRRGSYKPVKEQSTDLGDNFTYTRRIEQFSNPDIVASSNDDDLKYYYNYANDELAGSTGYASPATINIYVENPYADFWSPYYYPSAWSWAWRPAYYNPWWAYNYWNYGPSFSFGWNSVWGPSWSWNWGPSWGWGPGWDYGWGWHPPYPPHHHHPVNPGPSRPSGWVRPGASGPNHRPSADRGGTVGRRPAGTRPSVTTGNRGNSSNATAGRRPTTTRPSTSTYNPSNATRPGNTNVSTGRTGFNRGGTQRSTVNTSGRTSSGTRSSYNSNSYNSSSSGRSSYNSGRSSYNSGRSSGSSYNSGRSGGGYNGGGRSSGSGRSRGGRR